MKISLIVEGQTEKAFLPHLKNFLHPLLVGRMPRFDVLPCTGRIYIGEKLRKEVSRLLSGRESADHVIALTDVYTGTNPRIFEDANDAKKQMKLWVGDEPRFHPHAAQYDFEAWLLPYWPTIQKLALHNRACPSGEPEHVNHDKPPAHRIKEVFQLGACRDSYIKPRDAGRILRDNDLSVAVKRCPELRSLVNTILRVSGAPEI